MIRAGVVVGNCSDVGKERTDNEDYFAYYEEPDEAQFSRVGRIAIVADGMGGHSGGREASRLAVETIWATYRGSSAPTVEESLLEAFASAHRAIRDLVQSRRGPRGMGTTATALVVRRGCYHIAHVGDSRAYLVREGRISQLTRDHTRVAALVREGALSAADAALHPGRHVLTQALGSDTDPEVEIAANGDCRAGDVFVLCTDGLSGAVRDDEILTAAVEMSPREASRSLVALANQRGGTDNITVQVIALGGESVEGGRPSSSHLADAAKGRHVGMAKTEESALLGIAAAGGSSGRRRALLFAALTGAFGFAAGAASGYAVWAPGPREVARADATRTLDGSAQSARASAPTLHGGPDTWDAGQTSLGASESDAAVPTSGNSSGLASPAPRPFRGDASILTAFDGAVAGGQLRLKAPPPMRQFPRSPARVQAPAREVR